MDIPYTNETSASVGEKRMFGDSDCESLGMRSSEAQVLNMFSIPLP